MFQDLSRRSIFLGDFRRGLNVLNSETKFINRRLKLVNIVLIDFSLMVKKRKKNKQLKKTNKNEKNE